jgi:AraC-like DNA-binding protein
MIARTDEEIARRARALPVPEDYFAGVNWDGMVLPRNVLCFSRVRQSHEIRGWEGISSVSGRYDQHARFVLLVLLEGAGQVGVETEVWALKPGHAIVMFPHQVHYYMELPDNFCWLFVTFELEKDGRGQIEALRNQPREVSERAGTLLNEVLDAYAHVHSAENALDVSMKLGKALQELNAGAAVERRTADAGLIARSREYVFGHLDGDLSVNAIADEMGCSGSYLRERFREEAGVSLGHFVRSVRLVRATHLLRETNEGVGTIAKRCGFGAFTTFSRAFAQVYGMSPSEYRKVASGNE